MPGTIQVSVDLKGVRLSPASPQFSIKVSMGKREYQTWETGDFSFPLTTLRDNVVMTLLDGQGNEASCRGFETKLIIEKGVWDEIVLTEGGGQVQVKLQFVLSEEDRIRIRSLRETALSKKREKLMNNSSTNTSISTSNDGNTRSRISNTHEVSGQSLQDSDANQNKMVARSIPVRVMEKEFVMKNKVISDSVPMLMITDGSDGKEGSSSVLAAPMSQKAAVVHPPKVDQRDLLEKTERISDASKREAYKVEKPKVLGKSSSNVKKMISAFQSNLTQETNPLLRPPLRKPQPNQTIKDLAVKSSFLNEFTTKEIKPSAQETQPTPPRHNVNLKKSRAPNFQTEGAEVDMNNQREITSKEVDVNEETRTTKEIIASGNLYNKEQFPRDRKKVGEPLDIQKVSIDKRTENTDLSCKQGFEESPVVNETEVDPNNRRKIFPKEGYIKEETKITDELTSSSNLYREEKLSKRTREIEKALDIENVSDEHTNLHRKQRFEESPVLKEIGEVIPKKNTQKETPDVEYFESFGLWIYPDDKNSLCMTTSGKRMMGLIGNCSTETTKYREKMEPIVQENTKKKKEHEGGSDDNHWKKIEKLIKPKLESLKDIEEGPIAKVIKAGIVVGFATLVLLTRQQKHR